MNSTALRVGFAGTPDFAVPSLEHLIAAAPQCVVERVWTQPDRPAGRGRKLASSPVKQVAERHGIKLEQPRSLRNEAALAVLREAQLDLLVVAAYGLLLPQAALDAPRRGCINVHASLLPRWRGAAPIQRAIAAGDTVSGVSIMQMEAGLDTGPVWQMAQVRVGATMTGGQLHDELAVLGAKTLLAALPRISAGSGRPRQQDDFLHTYAGKLSKREARVDWSLDAVTIANQVRAFSPWPVADTLLAGSQLRLWSARPGAAPAGVGPGMLQVQDGQVSVGTGAGALLLDEVQLAGRKRQPAAEFARNLDSLPVALGC